MLFFDPYGLLRGHRDEFRKEVQRLLAPAGLHVLWLNTHHIPERDAKDIPLRAILMPKEADDLELSARVMGVTAAGERVVYVFYTSVLRTLEVDEQRAFLRTAAGRRICAIGIARVLVHELVHVAAPELPHSEGGLMSSRLTRQSLTATDVALPPGSAKTLRSALLQWIGDDRRQGK